MRFPLIASLPTLLHRFIYACVCVVATTCAGAQTTVDIHAIQINLPQSPYLNKSITTTGIVIAVLSDGFYIENPTADFDSNVCTAEGIYVYTPSGVPSNAVVENSVTVTGVVEASNSSSYAGTQIHIASPDATNVITVSTGNALPTAISSSTLTSATNGTCSLYAARSFGQWLPFEGMRVNVPSSSSLMVAAPTGGIVDAANQSATSDGEFWAVFTTTRPFRAAGISELDTVPSTAPSTVERWSGNPQLVLVDTTTLGGTAIDAAAGTTYTGDANLIGIVDYHVSSQGYTGLLLTSDTVSGLTSGNTITPTAAAAPSSGQITIATQDLNSLTAAETLRITKLADAIVNYEHSPDILAVQGAAAAALTQLESAISAAGGPSYTTASIVSTADSSSYVNAFLVNASKLNNPVVTRTLDAATYTTTSGVTASLFDRSPLVLTAGIPRTGTTDYNIVVANASLTPRTNIDSASLGPDVRLRRQQQAQQLTSVLENYEIAGDHLFVMGGFDSFEFSDGYVDALGILDGAEPTNTNSGSLVTLYDAAYNTVALENSTTAAPNQSTGETNAAASRYTRVENGSAEQTDHILISTEQSQIVSIDYARIGADFPAVDTYATSTVAHASDHDGVIAYLTVPYPSNVALTSSLNPSYYDESVTFTAKVTSASGTPTGTVTFYDGATELAAVTLSAEQATYTTAALSVGSHVIKAVYGGDASHESASASLTQVVEALLTATNILTCSPNPAAYGAAVTCAATLSGSSGVPTGSVTFYDGTTAIGTGALSNGVASYSTSSLTVGSHSITAVYAGAAPYGSLTSNPVSEIITSSFTLSIKPASQTVYTGAKASYTVTVTPDTGFTLDVALTCSGAPADSTCTLSPSTVTGGSGTASLVLQTNAPTNTSAEIEYHRSGTYPVALAGFLLLFILPKRIRRWGKLLLVIAVAVMITAGLNGCGSSGTLSGGTTPGTYTLTVTGTATDGTLTITKSTTTTVTVKSLF